MIHQTPLRAPERIETARLLLRGLEPGDFPGYFDYYTGDRTAGVGGPQPRDKVFERFCAMIGQWSVMGFGRYGIADHAGGPAFGHVGPLQRHPDDTEAEMSWTLWDAERTGRGFASEASKGVVNALFAWGWKELVVFVHPENTASLRLAARLGAIPDDSAPPPEDFPGALRFILTPENYT